MRTLPEPRGVEVLHEGRWWPGIQSAWRFDPERGRLAEVTYSVQYDWGRGEHLAAVPADRVRLPVEGE